MTITTRRTIKAGTLNLTLHENGDRLDELLAFGSRLNPRRGYLFISRVLGKHIPVRPSKMDAVHAELASRLKLRGPAAYVVGMAETAVGLGAGVARHLAGACHYCVYHHTTRFLVPTPWIRIREAHSHADTMHMAQLSSEARRVMHGIQDMVLVDDEISTGKTLSQLASTLMEQPELSRVKRLHIVSLVSWLSETARQTLLDMLPTDIDIHFVQLMAGTFTFTLREGYQPELPSNVDTDFCDVLQYATDKPLPIESEGLYGKLMTSSQELPPDELQANALDLRDPLVIFGMGEYLDAPFRLALQLERRGGRVMFQSSTRSPIALADAVTSRIEHQAPSAPGKQHFLYNPPALHQPAAFDGIGCATISRELETSHLVYRSVEANA